MTTVDAIVNIKKLISQYYQDNIADKISVNAEQISDLLSNQNQTDFILSDKDIGIVKGIFQEQELLPALKKMIKKGNKGDFYISNYKCGDHYVNPIIPCENNKMCNLSYNFIKPLYTKYFRDKEYKNILFILRKVNRMSWFIRFHKKIYKVIGNKKYYSLLREVLIDVDIHFRLKHRYKELISIGGDPRLMMSKKDRKKFNKLSDSIWIYRGISSRDPIYSDNFQLFIGNSWTTKKRIAIEFIEFYEARGREYGALLEYRIKKNDILSIFTDRKESEVFVDYRKMKHKDISMEYI